jgi:hypothetical protein
MGANRQELRDRIRGLGNFDRVDDLNLNEYINMAIDAAWPLIKTVQEDTSITVDDETYVYTPSASDITEQGIAQIWVDYTDHQERLLRRARQDNINGTWKVYLTEDQASRWDSYGLILRYHAKEARLANDTTDTEVPSDYIVFYAAALAALQMMTSAPQGETENLRGYQRVHDSFEARAVEAKKRQASKSLDRYVGYVRL